MEIQIIKDKHNYRYDTCTHCKSELKIKRNTVNYYYHYGYRVADVICPCCGKEFLIYK